MPTSVKPVVIPHRDNIAHALRTMERDSRYAQFKNTMNDNMEYITNSLKSAFKSTTKVEDLQARMENRIVENITPEYFSHNDVLKIDFTPIITNTGGFQSFGEAWKVLKAKLSSGGSLKESLKESSGFSHWEKALENVKEKLTKHGYDVEVPNVLTMKISLGEVGPKLEKESEK